MSIFDVAARMITERKSFTTAQLLPAWQSGRPIWTNWSTEKAVSEGYQASVYVYACVNRLMKAAASVPWRVSRKVRGKTTPLPGHPLELLFEKPNPYMSGQDLRERQIAHLCLSGNSLWSKIRVARVVAELWPIGPDGISPVPDRETFILRYEYRRGNVHKDFEPSDIVHVMFVNPADPYWGIGPLQTGARLVDTDVEAVKWNKASLQNRAIADGVFTLKQPLTTEQWQDARRQVREQHMGADGAHTPWVVGGDATWQQMSLSPVDLDFIEGRKLNREEFCALFGVPPPLIADYEHTPMANIREARRIFWLDTIIPLLEDLQAAYNLSLTPDFGDDLVLWFDVSNVEAIREDYGAKVNTAHRLWEMGVPFNLVNEKLELGFGLIPGGDKGYLPIGLLPVGTPLTLPPPGKPQGPPTHEKEPEEGEEGEAGADAKALAWNVGSEEARVAYWRSIEQRRLGWYTQVQQKAAELFAQEAALVEAAYREGGRSAVLAAIDKHSVEWRTLLAAIYTAVSEEFGRGVVEGLPKSFIPPETKAVFDPFDQLIQDWVRQWAARRAVLLSETSKERARAVILDGIATGRTIDQIAFDLRELYQEDAPMRAMTLARTEVVGASNFGSLAGARQTGLGPLKTWVSCRDERVRDDHRDIDGTEISMDARFHVGSDEMLYPGDPSAKPAQTINCRCVLAFRVPL